MRSLVHMFCVAGTQGRLLQWSPDMDASEKKKALLASDPDLQARFLRESALRKPSFLADIDFLDCTIRSEIMTSVQGAPAMTGGGADTSRRSHKLCLFAHTRFQRSNRMQLPLIPCYALTVGVSIPSTCISCVALSDGAHVPKNHSPTAGQYTRRRL